VVGAGISGLVAARQLHYFGFNVIVVEARNRMGGRVFSHTNEDGIVFDMGPQFVEGSSKFLLGIYFFWDFRRAEVTVLRKSSRRLRKRQELVVIYSDK
jgi:phytoene dehydrogenase-like protein